MGAGLPRRPTAVSLAQEINIMPFRVVAHLNKNYRHRISQMWENYCLVSHYAVALHQPVKTGQIAVPTLPDIFGRGEQTLTISRVLSSLGSLTQRHHGYVTFVYVVSAFEQCIADTVSCVYLRQPQLMDVVNPNQDTSTQDLKLLKIVVNATTWAEIIDQVAEERVRSIFYGNPMDVFLKDKCRMSLGSWFTDNCSDEMTVLREIIARRNVVVHNDGRVDRKYLRETKASTAIETKLDVDFDYMRTVFQIVIQVAGCFSALVLRNLFKQKLKGFLRETLTRYEGQQPPNIPAPREIMRRGVSKGEE